MKEEKRALRRRFLDRRAAMTACERKVADFAITESFLALPEYGSAETLLLYASHGNEVDTYAIAHAALRDGKRVAFPLCEADTHTMRFLICPPEGLRPGYREIPEPPDDAPCADLGGAVLCVLPGLAFDREGHRLGYGGGFYDRFLENFRGVTVGLARFLEDSLPAEAHDIPCQITVTEKEVIRR